MTEEKLCSVCKKSTAMDSCVKCGQPLCEECRKRYFHEELGPTGQTLGAPVSQIWTAQKYFTFCPQCFPKIDVFEYEPPWDKR